MSDRIPEEQLIAARLRFKRRVAALLLQVLAESGELATDIDKRTGSKGGAFERFIVALMHGTVKCGDDAVDIAYALGAELQISAQRLPELMLSAQKTKAPTP